MMAEQEGNPFWIVPDNLLGMDERRATMALAYEVRELRKTAEGIGARLDNVATKLHKLTAQVNKLVK